MKTIWSSTRNTKNENENINRSVKLRPVRGESSVIGERREVKTICPAGKRCWNKGVSQVTYW